VNFAILPKNISVYFVLFVLLFHNFHMKVEAFERLISCYNGAFEDFFCTGGGEFDQSNFKKFKFPGVGPGGGGHVEVSN
jgi:hypothetical protein